MQLKNLYPPKVRKAIEALLLSPAVCTTELRQGIEAYAARLSGGIRANQEIPDELVDFVEKVTQNAVEITDHEFQKLKEAGYSEDAIFEITLCASVGASLARLERGLIALRGDQHAPPSA